MKTDKGHFLSHCDFTFIGLKLCVYWFVSERGRGLKTWTWKHQIEHTYTVFSPGCCLIVQPGKNQSVWTEGKLWVMGATWISWRTTTTVLITLLQIQGGQLAMLSDFLSWCYSLEISSLLHDKMKKQLTQLFSDWQLWSVSKSKLLRVWKARDLTSDVTMRKAGRKTPSTSAMTVMTTCPSPNWYGQKNMTSGREVDVSLCTTTPLQPSSSSGWTNSPQRTAGPTGVGWTLASALTI